jgi:N-acyl-D-aspartate/D-glutamate deacylase
MQEYDVIIRSGTIYDGSGSAPYKGDVAIQEDVIAAVGDLGDARGKREVDANGLAVAPGFINMLSWSVESLIEDGRSQSEIRQGVTLEVMGEGTSMGPLSDAMKAKFNFGILGNSHIKYNIEWTTLGEYLEWLEKRGVSCNIASFVGSSTLRIHTVGYDDREATFEERAEMRDLIRQAMEEGAVGMSAALIYPPAAYASIDELIELASAVAEYDGLYISHIRGEGAALLPALEELIEITESAPVRSEVYHLKAAGTAHWDKMDEAILLVERARQKGLPITADMYPYPYSGTGLDACIPPWAHEGGHADMIERLKDPHSRQRIKQEFQTPSQEWENMYLENGPEKILLSGFQKESLKPLTGKTLAQVAAERGTSPDDTLMDLIVEDDSRIFTMYFCMSEDNLRKQMTLPWVSFCSDAESQAPEGVFLKVNPHPRAYGAFARVLAKYVRDEKLVPLQETIRRLTSLPASNLKIERRGALQNGYYADVVVFDPEKIQDHATPENPHQYATGMLHVFVNGVQVLENGDHTGAKPGRVVRGPGWKKKPFESIYPAELHPFLMLGGDYNGTYAEFGIGKSYIPALIRMATDENLLYYEPDRPQTHAPMHAWRRLGQLGAIEAAEPLLQLLVGHNLRSVYELPSVYAMIGIKAFPVLAKYMSEDFRPNYARVEAMNCLLAIVEGASDADEISFRALEGMLIAQLDKHSQNDLLFNAGLILSLARMESKGAVPLIIDVYNQNPDMAKATGPFEEIMERMGVRIEKETTEDDLPKDQPQLTPFHSKPDLKKKKAKRKQAEKIKKLNRKKRR